MNVRPGQRVEQGMKIGEVGRSGFSIGPYGYHLDFQITTADSPSHPYGFHDCEKWGYYDVVNEWRCKDKLAKYTVDPLEFFAKYADKELRPVAWRRNTNSELVKAETPQDSDANILDDQTADQLIANNDVTGPTVVVAPEIGDTEVFAPRPPRLEDDIVIVRRPVVSDNTNILVRTVLQEHAATVKEDRRQGTISLQPWLDISWKLIWSDYTKGQIIPVQFEVMQDDEPVSGKLTDRVVLSSDNGVDLLPSSFGRIFRGKKTVFMRATKSGEIVVEVKSGEVQLGQIKVVVK